MTVARWTSGFAALLAGFVLMVPASAQEQELLYVGNNHGGTVSVISVPDYEVIGEFDALPDIADRQTWPAAEHVDDLVAPESGEVLYLSRPRTRDLAAFSTETEELLWRLPVPGVPDHMALSMDGKILYLAISNEYMVVVINLEKREIIGQIPTGPQPHCVHLSPDGSRIYIGSLVGDEMVIADAKTFEVLRAIQFENGVRPFVLTPDEKKAYIQISKLHGFVELDLETDRISKTVLLPNPDNVPAQKAYPHTAHHGLALSPDYRFLTAVATVEGYTAILSVPDLDVLGTVPTGKEPSWVINSLDGKHVYVSGRKSNDVFVISIEDQRLLKRIKVGDYPQRMWSTRVPRRSVSQR
ncbi:MAG: YncE family protein [Gemmatimonadales bacterium]